MSPFKYWRKDLERKLKLESEAVEDLAQSYEYYENQKEGLGEEFAKEVKNKITKIVRKPDSYSAFYKETRKAPIKKFPFNLLYIIGGTNISIIGIWHKSRDPKKMQGRIDKWTE